MCSPPTAAGRSSAFRCGTSKSSTAGCRSGLIACSPRMPLWKPGCSLTKAAASGPSVASSRTPRERFWHSYQTATAWASSRSATASRCISICRLSLSGLKDFPTTQAEGFTSLRDALAVALALRDSRLDRAMILMLSDGVDTMSWLSQDQLAASAAHSEAVIYPVIKMTNQEAAVAGARYLQRLADQTGGRVVASRGRQEAVDDLSSRPHGDEGPICAHVFPRRRFPQRLARHSCPSDEPSR